MDHQPHVGGLRWPELIPAIHSFNHRPTAYADRSWLSFLPSGEFLEAVCSQVTGQRMLSEMVGRYYRLAPISEDRFCTATWRLVLLAPTELRRLILYAGVVAFSDYFARIIQGSTVRAFQKMLGVPLFDFAQKRARFLYQPRDELLQIREQFSVSPTEAVTAVQRTGAIYLSLMCAEMDSSGQVWKRARMKLPSSWSPEKESTQPKGAGDLILRLARNELNFHVGNYLS